MKDIELSNRQLEILSAIVANYIKNGVPVSSGTVYAVLKLDVCTSTIRSDMSYLTDKGFIRKIHTSSGSVPSAEGYKLYAKKVLDKLHSSKASDVNKVRESSYLSPAGKSLKELLFDLLNVISKNTKCLSFLYFENSDDLKIEDIKLLKVTDSFLSIFVVFTGEVVKNKNLRINLNNLPEEALKQLEDLLKKELCKLSLKDVSVLLMQKIATKNSSMFSFFTDVLGEVFDIIKEFCKVNFYFSEIPYDMFKNFKEQLGILPVLRFMKDKSLLNSFARKNNTLGEGIKVSVGRENSYLGLSDFSIVSSRYKGLKGLSGTVGIIGSMRMDYSSVIPTLSYVSSFFKSLFLNTLQ